MLKARKHNRVVRIPDEKQAEYEKLGYTITDEEGKVVYAPEDKDATIRELRLEIAQLKQKIAEYETQFGVSEEKPAKKTTKTTKKTTAKKD